MTQVCQELTGLSVAFINKGKVQKCPDFSDKCFQLHIRRFFGFRFVPAEFDLPPFQLSVPEISRAFLECPHNEKDVSTFVVAVSTVFILHNNPIHLFGFVYLTIKQTCIVQPL